MGEQDVWKERSRGQINSGKMEKEFSLSLSLSLSLSFNIPSPSPFYLYSSLSLSFSPPLPISPLVSISIFSLYRFDSFSIYHCIYSLLSVFHHSIT